MKLDTVEQRRKLVDDLKKASIKFRDTVNYDTDGGEGCGADVLVDDLLAVAPMITAEKLFLDALDVIKNSDAENRAAFANVVTNRLNYFIEMILMHRLNKTVDDLHSWEFKTEDGRKFFRSTHKKLDELVEKYQDLYDL